MSNEHTSSTQPLPRRTGHPRRHPVGDRLKQLIDQRTAIGIKKYGEPLHTFNGRSAELDALEEALDLCQYLMQALMESQAKQEWVLAALEESVLLQSHYARLLNVYDGGKRMVFETAGDWMARIKQVRQTAPDVAKGGQ